MKPHWDVSFKEDIWRQDSEAVPHLIQNWGTQLWVTSIWEEIAVGGGGRGIDRPLVLWSSQWIHSFPSYLFWKIKQRISPSHTPFGFLNLALLFHLIADNRMDSEKRNLAVSAAAEVLVSVSRSGHIPSVLGLTKVCEMLQGCQWGHTCFSQPNGMFF